jgi:integrase
MESNLNAAHREPWHKGKIVGQKAPFKVKDVWALRAYLKIDSRVRELALFNLGIDSKLRWCDLVGLRVRDICHGDHVASRATILQHKTQRPVQFEITPSTRDAVQKWIKRAGLRSGEALRRLAARGRDLSRDPVVHDTGPAVAEGDARRRGLAARQGLVGRGQHRTPDAPLMPRSRPRILRSVQRSPAPAGNRRRGDCRQGSGRMFWFMRKKFAGSYRALIC